MVSMVAALSVWSILSPGMAAVAPQPAPPVVPAASANLPASAPEDGNLSGCPPCTCVCNCLPSTTPAVSSAAASPPGSAGGPAALPEDRNPSRCPSCTCVCNCAFPAQP